MYIDPNTGGLIFQVLAILFGVISGVILIFSSKIKMGISKLRRIIRGKSNDEQGNHLNEDD
jgi:predicted permease